MCEHPFRLLILNVSTGAYFMVCGKIALLAKHVKLPFWHSKVATIPTTNIATCVYLQNRIGYPMAMIVVWHCNVLSARLFRAEELGKVKIA